MEGIWLDLRVGWSAYLYRTTVGGSIPSQWKAIEKNPTLLVDEKDGPKVVSFEFSTGSGPTFGQQEIAFEIDAQILEFTRVNRTSKNLISLSMDESERDSLVGYRLGKSMLEVESLEWIPLLKEDLKNHLFGNFIYIEYDLGNESTDNDILIQLKDRFGRESKIL